MKTILHSPLTALLIAVMLVLPLRAHAQLQDEDAIEVEVNKGTLVRLDRAAASVVIADPNIADVQVLSPRLVYVNGKRTGETTIFAADAGDGEVLNTTVVVTHNLSKLRKALKAMMPDATVNFSTVDGALVMNGDVASPLEADAISRLATPFLKESETLINMTQAEGVDQVLLQVKVVEVSRTSLKRFGIHFESVLNTGNFVFGLATERDVIDAGSNFLRAANGDRSIFGGWSSSRGSVSSVIDALEDEGLVSVLAEPSLTTLSGKPADFLAGGEIPIPSIGSDGQVEITYKPFGVSLNFTPIILSKDKISMTVAPEVSNLSETGAVEIEGFSIPSLVTRRATTTVELGSGQTFAIAGLLQSNGSNNVNKFPVLGDVPILGTLFRSNAFINDQTELVILVTPYLVRPVNDKSEIATPLDGYVPPSDFERILLGKLHGGTPENVQHAYPNRRLNGRPGFILK